MLHWSSAGQWSQPKGGRGLRRWSLRFLDHLWCRLTFGVVLPMMFAFWGSFLNSRGELDGGLFASVDFLWISIAGLAWVFGYWCFTEADKSVRSAFLATALSLGTALAALFAAISVWVVGWILLRPTNDLVLMGTAAPVAFALAAALALTVSFRAATRAWAATQSRARLRPQRTVLAIVAAPYSLLVLGWILAAA